LENVLRARPHVIPAADDSERQRVLDGENASLGAGLIVDSDASPVDHALPPGCPAIDGKTARAS